MRCSCSTIDRNFFPLTNLQIRHQQLNLSRLSIFLTPSLKKLYFLVDNRPRPVDEDIRPAGLMVTKVYGFIVFEVEWANVRGINYLNKLQTDTSMALEMKILRWWEFDSIEQSSTLLSSWFPGSSSERRMLQEYLDSMCPKGDVFYDAPADSSGCRSDSSGFSSCLVGSTLKERLTYTPPSYSEIVSALRSLASSSSDSDTSNPSCEATSYSYRYALVSFKFHDHDLPFKLREVITSDLRLLTLLEYGLPSWVMFLQSYPLFCKMYRPLARFLYVLMSIITVLIGFYDLYKHVLLMNATLSKLFGPIFEWIQNWDMISTIQYLGTMLSLHNLEQVVEWALQVMPYVKSFFSVLTQPVVGPLINIVHLIVWNLMGGTMKYIGSLIWPLLETSWSVVTIILKFIRWPFKLELSTVLNIASNILSPILSILGKVMSLPFHVVSKLSNLVSTIFLHMYKIGSYIFSMFQVASASKDTATGVAYEASVLKSLWNNDLFSQVFRPVRSILNGLVAFFSTCNEHCMT